MSDTIDIKSPQAENITNQELFQKQWNIYQKVLHGNYMGHCEIYNILHDLLVNKLQQPFNMLDLGCGDACFTAQALSNTNIAAYTGIDLSDMALEIARNNMNIIHCEQHFIQGDFSVLSHESFQQKANSFDLIMASFALHHLFLPQKDLIFGEIAKMLKPNGIFILIDVFRKELEERNTYLKRYLDDVKKRWSLLTPQECLIVEEHISSSDFPETAQTLSELGRKHGFKRCDCLYQDSLDTTQLLCFFN